MSIQSDSMATWSDWLDAQSRRRPLACASVGFAAGISTPILAGILVLAALVARGRGVILLAAAAIAGWARGAIGESVPPIPFGMPRTFQGTVARAFEADASHPWRTRQFAMDLDEPHVRVLAQGWPLPPGTGAGDRVELSGVLAPLPPRRATAGFDMRRWLDREGVHALLKTSAPPRALPGSRHPLDRLRRLRHVWGNLLTRALRDETASRLARSILLGDRDAVSRDSERAFRATGTNHVLVASGMNVMLLASAIAWILSRTGTPRPLLRSALLLLCVSYAVIAGADAPIVRAAIALSAWLLAEAVGRPPDPLNLLGLAALALLAADPRSLADPAFQLSFVAVASLVLVTPALLGPRAVREEEPSFGQRLREGVKRLAAANAAAWIGTAPLVLCHFGTIAPIALLANLVVAPLVWLVLTSSLALLAWQALPLPTPVALAFVVALPARALDGFVALAARVPGGCISAPRPDGWCVAVCYACILAGAAIARRRFGRG